MKYAPKLAGFLFLFLIATGASGLILFEGLRVPDEISATLINISEHPLRLNLSIFLSIISGIATVVLAVMLYAMLKEQDENMAVLVFSFRMAETMIIYPVAVISALLLILMSQQYVGQNVTDPVVFHTLGISLLSVKDWSFMLGAIFFSAGSTLFSYLFLKARSIPIWISTFGVIVSLSLLLGLSLHIVSLAEGFDLNFIWFPLTFFELVIGLWLLVKGIKPSQPKN